jgi:hypothetical protein
MFLGNVMDIFLDSNKIIVKISPESLQTIIFRLKDSQIGYCHLFDDETVQTAFCQWLDAFLNDIENEPEWFIKDHKKVFINFLPDVPNLYQDVEKAA